MDIQSLLYRLRTDLGDLKRRRWTDDEILVSYLSEGLCAYYAENPDRFRKTCIVPLQPGVQQCVEDCCKVHAVQAIVDRDGEFIASVLDLKGKAENAEIDYPLNKRSCLSASASNALTRSVMRYGGSAACFSLHPGVDRCDELFARVEMSCEPAALSIDTVGDIETLVGCSVLGPVIHYALSMARRQGSPSQSERQMAGQDYQIFAGQKANATKADMAREAKADE